MIKVGFDSLGLIVDNLYAITCDHSKGLATFRLLIYFGSLIIISRDGNTQKRE